MIDIAMAIGAAVQSIIIAAGPYYSRQRALSEMRKREVCKALVGLRDSLIAIEKTGGRIRQRLTNEEVDAENIREMKKLIRLLEEQNRNLVAAKREFKFLSTVFDIQCPELNPLIIHLRGKANRIQILYTEARNTDVLRQVRHSIQSWERSQMYDEPKTFLHDVETGRFHHASAITLYEDPEDPDAHFQQIRDCVPTLTEFIRKNCPAELLIRL